MNIQISEVNVREIQREDVPDLRAYFFDSPPEFLNSIGLRTPRPGDADAMIAWLEERFQQREAGGPPTPILTVIYRGERVGVHTTTHHVPGKSLIMHAHFFRKDLRGKGIGRISYVLALEKFLTEYGYQEVIFKTPIGNVAPMKIKEVLGLESIGEEVINWDQLVRPLQVKVYRVTPQDLPRLKKRVGLEKHLF